MMRTLRTAALLLVALCAAAPSRAQFTPQATAAPGSAPQGINYQGRLEDNGFPATGTKQMVFRVFDVAAGGTALWTSPTQGVEVSIGLFNAVVPVPITALVGGGSRYLEVQIDGTVMAPRELLNSVPYALIAKSVEGTIDVSTAGLSVLANSAASTPALYISSQTGNVGVGTSSPGTAFDVDGAVQFGSAAKSTFTAGGGLLTGTVVFSSGMATGNSFTVGASTLVVRFGRVGVGTLAPQSALDVEGAAQFGSAAKSTFTAAGGLLTGAVVFSSGMATGNSFTVGASTLVVRFGRVGVGTLLPQAPLDVEGAAQFGSGAAKSTFTAAGGLRVPVGVSIGTGTQSVLPLYVRQTDGSTPAAAFNNTGSGHMLEVTSNGGLQHLLNGLDSRYRLTSNAVLELGAAGHDYGALGIGSSGLYSAITSGGSGLNGGIREMYFFTNNDMATAKMKIASNGSVGVGTVNPASKLHLSSGTVFIDGSGARLEISNNSSSELLKLRHTTSTGYQAFRLYNDLDAAANSLEMSYGGSAHPGQLITGGPLGESGALFTRGAFPLAFGTSNAVRMTIAAGGDVGIGTSSPASKLHLSTGTIVVDGSTANSLVTTGNVGVGTNDPQSRLQVVGGYLQLPTVSGADPAAADCDTALEAGRAIVRSDGAAGFRLWVCTGAGGWVSF